MNQKQAETLANAATLIAKMRADPVIVRYERLKKFAESVNLRLSPASDEEHFEIKDGRGRLLFRCVSTEDVNDWFKEHYMEEVL